MSTVTVTRELAQELLSSYVNAEVTITSDRDQLLAYAQGLRAKCDELGKQRDLAKAYSNGLSNTIDELKEELNDAIGACYDYDEEYEHMTHRIYELSTEIDKLRQERDEAREWACSFYDLLSDADIEWDRWDKYAAPRILDDLIYRVFELTGQRED